MIDKAKDRLTERGRVAPARPRLAATILGLLALLSSLLSLSPADTRAEAATHALVMIDDPACVFCRRWLAEIGPTYPKTAEGRFAPLVRRDRSDPSIRYLKNVAYTPTFVLIRGETEIGRIVGYGGEDHFWGQLEQLFAKAGFKPDAAPAPAPEQRETRLDTAVPIRR